MFLQRSIPLRECLFSGVSPVNVTYPAYREEDTYNFKLCFLQKPLKLSQQKSYANKSYMQAGLYMTGKHVAC